MKTMYHPMLGRFSSEIPAVYQDDFSRIQAGSPQSLIKGRPGQDLIDILRDHHVRLQTNDFKQRLLSSPKAEERLSLGQVVALKQRLCASRPDTQIFFGVVIEMQNEGWSSFVRLRTIITGVGVEMKVKVFNPLVEEIRILRRPSKVPVGPNLFKVRESKELMGRFLNPSLFIEKNRLVVQKMLEQGKYDVHSML